jgi:hypothetical protein
MRILLVGAAGELHFGPLIHMTSAQLAFSMSNIALS